MGSPFPNSPREGRGLKHQNPAPGQPLGQAVAQHPIVFGGVADLQALTGQWLTLEPWQPARRQPAGGGLRDRLWRGAALLAREAAAALLAWARSAEARASRAQGCISAGESMASAGALK